MRNYQTYIRLQERLKNLCSSYADGNLPRKDFLRRVARNKSLGDNPNQEIDNVPNEQQIIYIQI
jgi:hypothetical protein